MNWISEETTKSPMLLTKCRWKIYKKRRVLVTTATEIYILQLNVSVIYFLYIVGLLGM